MIVVMLTIAAVTSEFPQSGRNKSSSILFYFILLTRWKYLNDYKTKDLKNLLFLIYEKSSCLICMDIHLSA